MYTIFHLPLCSNSRIARLVLSEKKIIFELKSELTWKRRIDFLKMNPAGTVPVIIDNDKTIIIGSDVLAEYLDEQSIGHNLIGNNPREKMEVRRLFRWFYKKFEIEVTNNILYEKIFKRLEGLGEPSSRCLRAGRLNLNIHMSYLNWLLNKRTWLSGELMNLSDLTGASYLSSLDYLGEISWDKYMNVKRWYANIKSRPSFRPFLNEIVPGIPPSRNYKNLDF